MDGLASRRFYFRVIYLCLEYLTTYNNAYLGQQSETKPRAEAKASRKSCRSFQAPGTRRKVPLSDRTENIIVFTPFALESLESFCLTLEEKKDRQTLC